MMYLASAPKDGGNSGQKQAAAAALAAAQYVATAAIAVCSNRALI